VSRDELLAYAKETEEEYYTAPLGNIKLVPVDGESLRRNFENEESTNKDPGKVPT